MGGTWVDYNLQTTIQVVSIGESNFSDHGANRLGASALMQGLMDCSSFHTMEIIYHQT
jgi:succinate dehydrogenase / fumarate reductase flavoprotein subunit